MRTGIDGATEEWCVLETLRRDPCLIAHLLSDGFSMTEATTIARWAWKGGPKVGEDLLYFIRSIYIPTRRIQLSRKVPTWVRDPDCPTLGRTRTEDFEAAFGIAMLAAVPDGGASQC